MPLWVTLFTTYTALATGIGSIAVFDSGDDMVIGVNTSGTATGIALINVINGDDMIKTTVTGTNVATGASNFGFTLSSTSGGLTITFA